MKNKIMTAQEAVAGIQDGATIMAGGFMACGTSGGDGMGQLSLSLTDKSSIDYDQVWVTIKDIYVHASTDPEDTWTKILDVNRTVDLLTLANNHALDSGQNGLDETRQCLMKQGITPLDTSSSPYIITINGIRLNILAFDDIREALDLGQASRLIQAARQVFDVAGKLRYQKRNTPTDEHEAIVESQVLRTKEVGSDCWHQRQSASVLPIRNAYGKKQQRDVARSHDAGHQKQANCRNNPVEQVSIGATDFVGIHSGANTPSRIHKSTE